MMVSVTLPAEISAADGVYIAVAECLSLKVPVPRSLGFIPLFAGILTILMAIQTEKWRQRSLQRIARAKDIERARGIWRLNAPESFLGSVKAGIPLFVLMLVAGLGLLIYSFILFVGWTLP